MIQTRDHHKGVRKHDAVNQVFVSPGVGVLQEPRPFAGVLVWTSSAALDSEITHFARNLK